MNFNAELRDIFLSPYFGLFIFGAIVFAIAFLQKGRMKESKVSPATIAGVVIVFILLIAAIPTYQWVTKPAEEPAGKGGGMPQPAAGSDDNSGKGGGSAGKAGGSTKE